ncbi:sigma-70 family RNA polymerase sigma factor [Streptacidiphilus sp. 4-A2]|nr:sigma-70 family RNA polymerase sigma factor [Streptacidiphilus sp. 4-A2]
MDHPSGARPGPPRARSAGRPAPANTGAPDDVPPTTGPPDGACATGAVPTGAPTGPAPGAPAPTAADPALRDSFLGLLRSLAAARALDPDDLEQQVWLRAAAERRVSRPAARLRALTVQEFRRALAERGELARARAAAARLAARARPDDGSPEQRTLAAERARELRTAAARLPARCPALVAALLEAPTPAYRELGGRTRTAARSIGPLRARCLACLRRMLHPG